MAQGAADGIRRGLAQTGHPLSAEIKAELDFIEQDQAAEYLQEAERMMERGPDSPTSADFRRAAERRRDKWGPRLDPVLPKLETIGPAPSSAGSVNYPSPGSHGSRASDVDYPSPVDHYSPGSGWSSPGSRRSPR